MKKFGVLFAACALSSSLAMGFTLADFNSGIGTVVNHPNPGTAGEWYDITSDAFATPSAGTFPVSSSPCLQIVDGGFTNGVYVQYAGLTYPAGNYRVTCKMHVTEDGAQLNSIKAYQIGIRSNGSHRPAGGDLFPASNTGDYAGLTTGNDSSLAPQTVITTTFAAAANASIIVGFSTDMTSGNFDLNSGTFGAGAAIRVDDIVMELAPAAGVSDWALY